MKNALTNISRKKKLKRNEHDRSKKKEKARIRKKEKERANEIRGNNARVRKKKRIKNCERETYKNNLITVIFNDQE